MLAVELHTVGGKAGRSYSNLLTGPVYSENSIVVVAWKGGRQHHPARYENAMVGLTASLRVLPPNRHEGREDRSMDT